MERLLARSHVSLLKTRLYPGGSTFHLDGRYRSLSIVMRLLLLGLFPGWLVCAGYTCTQLLLVVLPRLWLSGFGAVVEVVPGGTPFHLDGCWCHIGDLVWSFSPGLVPVSPEHLRYNWSSGSTPLGGSFSSSGTLFLLLECELVYGS